MATSGSGARSRWTKRPSSPPPGTTWACSSARPGSGRTRSMPAAAWWGAPGGGPPRCRSHPPRSSAYRRSGSVRAGLWRSRCGCGGWTGPRTWTPAPDRWAIPWPSASIRPWQTASGWRGRRRCSASCTCSSSPRSSPPRPSITFSSSGGGARGPSTSGSACSPWPSRSTRSPAPTGSTRSPRAAGSRCGRAISPAISLRRWRSSSSGLSSPGPSLPGCAPTSSPTSAWRPSSASGPASVRSLSARRTVPCGSCRCWCWLPCSSRGRPGGAEWMRGGSRSADW